MQVEIRTLGPAQKEDIKLKFETLMKQIESKAKICKNLVHNF